MTRAAVLGLTSAALIGFAANSLLCRAALARDAIDAATFTAIRLGSGALVLAVLAHLARPAVKRAGDWRGALALFAYAIAFSFAYTRIPAGIGALVLFGCVQATMMFGGMRAGERPRIAQWAGLALALGGLGVLTGVIRGTSTLAAPNALGTSSMALAGIAWGVYSLLGRGRSDPLVATAQNFARSVPFAVVALIASSSRLHVTSSGVALAVASGALTSGVGYSLWYAVLPHLRASSAAIVQLSVPVLTAAAGFTLLDEALTTRSVLAGATILSGIALALLARR